MGPNVEWLYEDELPKGYPYRDMFPYSKLGHDGRGGARLFPKVLTRRAAALRLARAKGKLAAAMRHFADGDPIRGWRCRCGYFTRNSISAAMHDQVTTVISLSCHLQRNGQVRG